MGLDFVGNPNKIDFEDIDDIGVDVYSDDDNDDEAFGNWIDPYESSEYDDANDFDYDPFDYDQFDPFASDVSSSNGSGVPEDPLSDDPSEAEAGVVKEDEVVQQQQKGDGAVTDDSATKSAETIVPDESVDPNMGEANSDT